MDLSTYINYLLKKKDQAIIPGLGIFNLIKTSAAYEEKNNTYLPPSSYIEFIQMNEAEDNELAMLISLYENVTNEEATERTVKISADILDSIGRQGSFSLKDIGTLTMDENNRIIFTADILSPIANKYYGMPKVEAESPHNENVQTSLGDKENINEVQKSVRKRVSKRRIMCFTILSLFLVSIIICTVYIASNYEESTSFIHKKGILINDFLKKLFPDKMNNDTLSGENDKIMNNNADNSVTDTITKIVTDTLTRIGGDDIQSYIIEPGAGKKYFIIAGCFRDIENAGKMIKELEGKNYKPVIAGKTPAGLYRVCYSEGFSSKRDATDEIIKIRLVFSNEPWLIEY